MKKTMLMGFGALIGAAVSYLFDPESGDARRARLRDQAAATARDAAEAAKKKFEYQKGVFKGVAHETTEMFESSENGFDDETLLQKVRSEAIGPWSVSSMGKVEVDIRDRNVTVTGSIGSQEDGQRLIERIRSVEGVEIVEDRRQMTTN